MDHAANEDLRDAKIAELALRHAAAVLANILAGHEQTLSDLASDVGDRLANNDVMAQLLRACAVGPLTVGNLFRDMVQRCIDAEAENEALKEIERIEAERAKSRAEAIAEQRIWAKAMREIPVFGSAA